MNFFLTGQPGIGKTTLVNHVMTLLAHRGYRAGGIFCPEIREGYRRVGFRIINILTGEKGILSHIHQPTGPRIGKYRVNLQDVSHVGVKAIEHALKDADYIVIDEIGPMELQSRAFQHIISRTLDNPKPVLGILHWRLRHPIIQTIRNRQDVAIYDVTQENRDSLPRILADHIQQRLQLDASRVT